MHVFRRITLSRTYSSYLPDYDKESIYRIAHRMQKEKQPDCRPFFFVDFRQAPLLFLFRHNAMPLHVE